MTEIFKRKLDPQKKKKTKKNCKYEKLLEEKNGTVLTLTKILV